MDDDNVNIVRNGFSGMSDFNDFVQPYNIGLMWTLLLIDNQDAKGVSPSEFYKIMHEGEKHAFTFELPSGERAVINNISGSVPAFIDNLDISLHTIPGKTFNVHEIKKNALGIDVLVDWGVDWSKYKTFDFAITSNDPLTDKAILNSFVETLDGFMRRDESNPDLIITIARNAKNSISYSYIPPTTTYVKTGSMTKKVYSWTGMSSHYETQDHLAAVHQDGYIQEISTSDVFLEISMLDAKRLDSKIPPVVYKATYQKSYPKKIDILEELKYYAGSFGHPSEMKHAVSRLEYNNSIPFAMRWGWASENNIITQVYKLGRFINKGDIPCIGDNIISIKKKTSNSHRYRCDKITMKYKDAKGKNKSCELLYYAELAPYGGIRGDDIPLNDWSLGFYPFKMTVIP